MWLKVKSAYMVTPPCVGSLRMGGVRLLASTLVLLFMSLAAVLALHSFPSRRPPAPLSLLATGASLTGVSVIETVAVALHLGSATGGEPVVPLSQVLSVEESLVVSLPSRL